MKVINAGKAWETRMRYAPAVLVESGPLVFTSGLVGRDADGTVVAGGMRAQAHQAFINIRDVLHAAGSSMSDVVKVTVHLAHQDRDFEGFDAAYKTIFQNPYPVRTTVGSDLGGILIEVDAVAAGGA